MLRAVYLLLSTAMLAATSGFAASDDPAMVSAGPSSPASETEIARVARDRDGLFYLTLAVNDRPVRFLIDTGASVVVLSRADASGAGIVAAADEAGVAMRTAGGLRRMRWASANRMVLAARNFGPVSIAIADAPSTTSLLGQNVLSRLGTVTIRGDTLIVSAPTPTGG